MNDDAESDNPGLVSRRGLLKQSLAMAGGVAAAAGVGAAVAPVDPPVRTAKPSSGRRKFRAWVSRGEGPGRTSLQELTLRPIKGRQVVVRTEAASLCYSNVGAVLGIHAVEDPASVSPALRAYREQVNSMAMISGHGGIGIVEAVGPDVRRVKVGDRVCVSGTPQCGVCYQCLRGRSDMCQFLGAAGVPGNLTQIAEMRDGTPVHANSEIGGLAELMVTFEEWVVPIQSSASAAHLGMVCSCVSVAGLGATTSQGVAVLSPGSIVAVMGCGPLGLSAVQGARIAGASTIIAIDPVRARRELARRLGATEVLDPNAEGDALVAKVQEISMRANPGIWAGGRYSGGLLGGSGADFVVEAAGAEWVPPRVERGPDPTGLLPMRQAFEMTAAGGQLVTTGLARGNVSLPAALFSLGARTQHSGQAGGCSPLRDIPRFVRLLDSGQFNAEAILTSQVPFDKMLEGYEEVAYRTTVFALLMA